VQCEATAKKAARRFLGSAVGGLMWTVTSVIRLGVPPALNSASTERPSLATLCRAR
jgi:hypothetical protein